jgi:hypothetical protein
VTEPLTGQGVAVHQFWLDRQKDFAKETDLTNFKNWDVVRGIPLYTDREYFDQYGKDVIHMINASPHSDEWSTVLLTGEPQTGHSPESFKQACKPLCGDDDVITTPFRLKSLHHVLTFEQMSEKSILCYDHIIEFGAGIGDTAHTILERGFKGSYQILDLPEVQKISKYYLEPYDTQVSFPTTLEEVAFPPNTLFIATWSLSEAPLEYRDAIAAKLKEAIDTDYMILFQMQFKEILNSNYFVEKWPYLTDSFYRLKQIPFHGGDGGNLYIIGRVYQ